jgi:isopenicillin-N N-acyltransferase-like protein
MTQIPVLTAEGDAYARGLAHGKRFSREIAQNIESYLRRFAASGLGRQTAVAEAERWGEAIAGVNPSYAEEMRGIADGAGQSESAIALLNARYEFAFILSGREAMRQELLAAGPDGCTTFGLMSLVTADGHTWLGQNWDWLEAIHGCTFVLRAHRKDGPSFACLTEAGIAGGKMGVNECGIGLVENGLASSDDGKHPYRKPFHVRCREVLDAQRFDEALRPLMEAPRTCSGNFVVGTAGGPLCDIETSADHASQIDPEDGIVTHSNHFLTPGHGESLLEKLSPNTLYRADRMRVRLAAHRPSIAFQDMRAAASDHDGAPYGICRHPDASHSPAKRTMTVGAVLIDLESRTMHVANGPPCSNAYVAVGI